MNTAPHKSAKKLESMTLEELKESVDADLLISGSASPQFYELVARVEAVVGDMRSDVRWAVETRLPPGTPAYKVARLADRLEGKRSETGKADAQ